MFWKVVHGLCSHSSHVWIGAAPGTGGGRNKSLCEEAAIKRLSLTPGSLFIADHMLPLYTVVVF